MQFWLFKKCGSAKLKLNLNYFSDGTCSPPRTLELLHSTKGRVCDNVVKRCNNVMRCNDGDVMWWCNVEPVSEKIDTGKKSRNQYRENLVLEKCTGIGIENIWYWKKYLYSLKFWVPSHTLMWRLCVANLKIISSTLEIEASEMCTYHWWLTMGWPTGWIILKAGQFSTPAIGRLTIRVIIIIFQNQSVQKSSGHGGAALREACH